MFPGFSKFNALFVRASIRGAIQEYQSRLIENVKADIATLQNRFRLQYYNSEAYEMSKIRDIPPVSGSIIWIRQIERQLNTYMKRVEAVLGKGWQHYAEGQKLHAESVSFRQKLDSTPIYEAWLASIAQNPTLALAAISSAYPNHENQERLFMSFLLTLIQRSSPSLKKFAILHGSSSRSPFS